MNILVLSENHDYHGVAVKWGLEKLGRQVRWWERSLFPETHKLSLEYEGEQEVVAVAGLDILSTKYRSIWVRRGAMPTVSAELSAADRKVAELESRSILTASLEMVCAHNSDALVVNHPKTIRVSETKGYQLFVARKAGFRLPRTLMSNDPEAVRHFHFSCKGDVVVKLQYPFVWKADDGNTRRLYTSVVTEEQLQCDEALAHCPMTYQEKIHRDYEIRITCFGRSAFAARQDIVGKRSAGDPLVDIRGESIQYSPYEAPKTLLAACFKYMNALGLNYAAFDIVRSVTGVYYFLEANQSGQFLYIETAVPSLPILDAFCNFLAAGVSDFCYVPGKHRLLMGDFDDSPDGQAVLAAFNEKMDNGSRAPFQVGA